MYSDKFGMNKNRKYKANKALAIILTLLLCVQMMPASVFAEGETPGTGDTATPPAATESKDVTNLLTDKTAVVKQDDKEIGVSGTIDSTKDIKVEFSFGVPVKESAGDGTAGKVAKGDTAKIKLASNLSLSGTFESRSMNFTSEGKTIKLGTVTYVRKEADGFIYAYIVFDGDPSVFDGTKGYTDVKGYFTPTFKYEAKTPNDNDQIDTVQILGKTYNVNIPALATVPTIDKTGIRDGQFINWKIKVEAKKGETQVSLKDYVLADDFSGANGEYVADSFKIGSNEGGKGAAAPATDPTIEGKKLTYTFGEVTGPQYVFLQTEIDDGAFFANKGSTYEIKNTAKLSKDGETPVTDTEIVPFTSKWITKKGVVGDAGKVTWTIEGNQNGDTLKNVEVTDKLQANMKFESATLKIGGGEPKDIIPNGDVYSIGNISTSFTLTIVAKYNGGEDLATNTVSVINKATMKWDGGEDVSAESKNYIGTNLINKTAGEYDKATHRIPWTVKVNKSDSLTDCVVYDMVFYGDPDTLLSLVI